MILRPEYLLPVFLGLPFRLIEKKNVCSYECNVRVENLVSFCLTEPCTLAGPKSL